MIKIFVIDGNGAASERVFDTESIRIGRSSKLDLSLADPAMSRQHARIWSADGRWHIEDMGSRNGTYVNQDRLEDARELQPGDRISVGSCVLELRDQSGDVWSAAAASTNASGHTLYRSAAELVQQDLPGRKTDTGDKQAVLRLAERLRILNEVHQALDQSIELDELLEMILDRAFDHLRPQEGAIYLADEDGSVRRAASRAVNGGNAATLDSHSLVEEVMERRQAALVLDAESDQRFNQAVSLISAGVRSLVAAPLLDPSGAVGMIVLSSTLAVRQFEEPDMELLASLASVAAMRIRNIRLAAEAAERQQLEQEVKLARRIQVALLPKAIPEPSGYVISGGNIPSRGVSGDFFKVIRTADESGCAIFVADVSGKGMAASLLTASLEALSAGPIEDGLPPHRIFNRVSRLLFERTPPEKFATAFLAMLDPETGGFHYANGGHNPGFLVRANGETHLLTSTGPPLGVMPAAEYREKTASLQVGDTLLVYTDGISEAENADEEEFGEERLLEVAVENRNAAPKGLAAAIERAVEEFVGGVPFKDDRTLVIVQRES